ncbi:protein-(glutamine-N5) methyltransferase, release factor-specific [Candidatus Peregrinibacteria bacterium CG1_02_54_53]|nr:MAG: protein-(glutamine-N5) methyltransferase, release factor-specific [Candidatus Peregrinibacteria bacterium CG1_02_54_53]
MTIDAFIRACGLPQAEAEILVARALGKDRTWLFAYGDTDVSSRDEKRILDWCERRRKGEPVDYIIGEREFYGRTFSVTPAVLIPRPATERLIEGALQYLDSPHDSCIAADVGISIVSKVFRAGLHPSVIVDCGTGSGCIGITLALERPSLHVVATDISASALVVARQNAERLDVADRIDFRSGNGLTPAADLQEPFLLVTNPPYIPEGTVLEHQVAAFEPASALFAGRDGTDVLRKLLTQARDHPQCVGMLCECQTNQANWLTAA